jgi:hypothetical protein
LKTVDTIQDMPAVQDEQLIPEKKWSSISGLREKVVLSTEAPSSVDLFSEEGLIQVWGIISNIYKKCQRVLGLEQEQYTEELNMYQGGFENHLNTYGVDERVKTIYRFLYFGFHMDLDLEKYVEENFYQGKGVEKIISEFKKLTALIIIAICEEDGFDLKQIKISSLYKTAAKEDELAIAANAASTLIGKAENSPTKLKAILAYLIHINSLI